MPVTIPGVPPLPGAPAGAQPKPTTLPPLPSAPQAIGLSTNQYGFGGSPVQQPGSPSVYGTPGQNGPAPGQGSTPGTGIPPAPTCPPNHTPEWFPGQGPSGTGVWKCLPVQGQEGGGWDRVGQYAEDDAACKAQHGEGWEAVPRPDQNSPRQCRQIGAGGGQGGGGGGGGQGGGGGFGPGAPGSGSGFDPSAVDPGLSAAQAELDALLTRIFNGEEPALPPGMDAAVLSRLKSIQEGQDEQDREGINRDLANRNVFGSGIGAELIAGSSRANAEQFAQGATDWFIEKAQLQYQQKIAALEVRTNELESRRRLILGQEGNAITRELGLKQIDLGLRRLQLEWNVAQLERDAAMDLAKLGIFDNLLS